MAENERYSIIDHTADIGLEAEGDTLDIAFGNAAYGMFDILTDGSPIDCTSSLEVKVEAEDTEGLLVNFLSELLYLYEVEGIVFREFSITITEKGVNWGLSGTARGEPFDPGKHNYPLEIKAVTYHMLSVREKPPYVRVIFDL